MSKLAPIRVSLPVTLKAEADLVFARLGITPSGAIRAFYKRVVELGALPWGPGYADAPAASLGPAEGIVGAEGEAEAYNGEWKAPTSPMPSQSLRR